jgi:hypothetical protein
MEVNQYLHSYILEAVDNQLRDSDPPIASKTYNRLLKEGYSEIQAKEMIGSALIVEIYETLKQNKPYDEARYTRNLKNLGKS